MQFVRQFHSLDKLDEGRSKVTKTAGQVTDQDMITYRATARQREEKERQELIRRSERAYTLAQQAAKLLKTKFGAERVILFGSLARGDFFHRRSDIDLIVAGIKSKDFWRAWAELDTLGNEFEIDLVDINTISPNLRLEIKREGVEL
jgi:predicted nucleotidyltransferase